jgi:transcriptional regulator with XRE-family HTH domain
MPRQRTKLIAARERLGLTRPQLARRIGLDRSYLYRIETGRYDPGLDTMVAWLKELGPDASIALFEPHPRMGKWAALVRKLIAQQLVA